MSTPIRAVVITVSDACSRGEREDGSGAALVELLKASGAEVVAREILSVTPPLRANLRTPAGTLPIALYMFAAMRG